MSLAATMWQWLTGQASPETVVNANFKALQHMAVYAMDPETTELLTWGYLGGRWGGFAVTKGTLTLTASNTNYVVVARATGVISVSTSDTNWNNTADYARAYKLVTGTTTVTSGENHLAGTNGVHGISNSGVSSLDDLLDVDTSGVSDGDVLVFDSATNKWIPGAGGGGGGISPSYVRVQVSNGYGSTNTRIRRFTTSVNSVGSDITYADSAANGASFTVNADGLYSINYVDSFNQAADLGISVNSNQLTTGVQSITDSHRYAEQSTGGNNFAGSCSAMAYLTAGDVIRPHTSGSPSGTVTNLSSFIVARIL